MTDVVNYSKIEADLMLRLHPDSMTGQHDETDAVSKASGTVCDAKLEQHDE